MYDCGGFFFVVDFIGVFYIYIIKWILEQFDWIIDGQVVCMFKNIGIEGCVGYFQFFMQIKFGIWVVGCKDVFQGIIEWVGGFVDFFNGFFDGYYQSFKIIDYMGGYKEVIEYQYGDKFGIWQSIKVIGSSGVVFSSSSVIFKVIIKIVIFVIIFQIVIFSIVFGVINGIFIIDVIIIFISIIEEVIEIEIVIFIGVVGKVVFSNMVVMGVVVVFGYFVF